MESIMPELAEPLNLGDILKHEAPKMFSRDAVTVAKTQNLTMGTVVGRVTSSDEIVAFDPSATDGSNEVAGIIITNVETTDETKRSVIIARHAAFLTDHVVFPEAITEAEKKAAIKALKSLDILLKEGA